MTSVLVGIGVWEQNRGTVSVGIGVWKRYWGSVLFKWERDHDQYCSGGFRWDAGLGVGVKLVLIGVEVRIGVRV